MKRGLLICLLLSAASSMALADALPPEPEQYVNDGRYSQYAQAAQAYLQSNSDSPSAPRVAMDLLVTASVSGDQASALRMRKLILSAYPDSLQAKYVVGTMRDATEFATLMEFIADDNIPQMPVGFPLRYLEAIKLGIARFGAQALGQAPELTRTAFILRVAGDNQILGGVLKLLNSTGDRGSGWRQALVIVTDEKATAMSRLLRLHDMTDRQAAGLFEPYLLNQLSPADRDSADGLKIQIDAFLEGSHFADALPLLSKLSDLPGAMDARMTFWQAVATAATGNSAVGRQMIDRLIQDHPNDPWTKEAQQIAPALGDLEGTLTRNVEAALAASRRLKLGMQVIEGQGQYIRSDGTKIDLYIGINSPTLLELIFKENGQVVLAYQATDQGASVYARGDSSISHYSKPVPLPAPQLSMARADEGFIFNAGVRFTTSFDEVESAFTSLLSSDYLTTRDGLQDLLRSFIRQGNFPLPIQTTDGGTTYEWLSPLTSGPVARDIRFVLDGQDAITTFQSGQFTLSNIRYGPAGAFALNAPDMPKLETVEKGPMDLSVLQKTVPLVGGLFSPPPPAPAAAGPATQPATAP